ncbi:MAG: S-layer homology domain-containing protein [Bacillota bacterium]
MCKRLSYILIILVLTAAFGARTVLAQPSDIRGHWAEKQIAEWTEKGLARGYPDGSFRPDSTITRAEFITMVNSFFGLSHSNGASFSDVKATDWFAGEMSKAKAAGYVAGYEDNTIKPNNPISRQEAAAMLASVTKLETSGSLAAANKFKDSGAIPQWSRGAIGAVLDRGYMSGYPDQTFQPGKDITRAEAISTLDRAVKGAAGNKVYDKAGTYGSATGTEIIEGNVTVSVRDVKLQNLVIKGDLLLAEGIGDGDVTLKSVTVTGNTIIKGGGAHSVVLEDCSMPSITINREGIRVVASGNTSVSVVTLESGAVLVQATISGPGIETVTVSKEIQANAAISLTGDFQTVNVEAANINLGVTEGTIASLIVSENAKGSVLNVASGAKLNNLTLNAAVSVKGQGKIEKAVINVSGSKIEQAPTNLVKAQGVEVSIGTTSVISSGGGGGGGGGNTPNNTETFSQAGVFGPATGTETHNKNVVIAVAGVTLQNMVINGDLEIAAGVGNGEVTLRNITVSGATKINGGGPNSVTMEDCNLPSLTVNKENVRIVAQGNTRVNVLTLQSGATLVEISVTGQGFETVTLSQVIPVGAVIELDGNFQSVNVQAGNVNVSVAGGAVDSLTVDQSAQGASVNVSSQAQVTTLTLNSAAAVSGTGTIQTANVNASGATIEQTPATVNTDTGVTVAIGSSAKEITAFSFAGQTGAAVINSATGTIAIEVANGTDLTGLVATFSLSARASAAIGAVQQVSGVTANNFSSPVTYVVTAENGTTRSWVVTVTVAVAAGSGIDVNLYEIWSQTSGILISIFRTTDEVDSAIPELAIEDFILIKDFGQPGNQVIAGISLYKDPFGGTWEYEILPSAGETFAEGNYRLGFSKEGYQPAHIDVQIGAAAPAATLVIGQIAPDPVAAGSQHVVCVPIGSSNINPGSQVVVRLYDSIAMNNQVGVQATGNITADGTAIVSFTVPDTAAAGKHYFVANVEGTYSDPKMFVVGPDASKSTVSAATTPLTPLVNGTFTFQINVRDANDNPISGLQEQDFIVTEDAIGELTIAVITEDGATGNYTVTAAYDAEDTITINAGVLYTLVGSIQNVTIVSDIVSVTGIAVKTGPAKVSYTEGENLDLAGLVVTLTKSDTSTEDVDFADFGAKGITAAPASGTALGTAVTQVVISHTATGVTASQAITVNPALSDQAEITAFSFTEQTGPAVINSAAGTIAIEVASGTGLTSLVATFSLSSGAQGVSVGETTQVSGVTANNFSAPVTYVVTAEDGSTRSWVVTVTEAAPVEPPAGDLLDADSCAGFIGVAYTRDGKIYYNQQSSSGVWGNEMEIGTGNQGKIAIDTNNNPHIAYTTNNRIGYRYYDGSAWSSEQLIESNNGGVCSKPDIAVDGSGYAHITYTDTMGNTHWWQNKPDIMYATNSSGSFTNQVIFDGYYENTGGSGYQGDYFNKGSFIALDSVDNYFIVAHNQFFNKPDMQLAESTYSIKVKSNLGNGSTTSSTADVFDSYDLASSGNKIVALYKQSAFKVSELTVSGTEINFANTSDISGTSVSSAATDGSNVVVGGISSSKLQTHYNGAPHVYNDIMVKGTKVSVLSLNGSFDAVYTDNNDGMIKIIAVAQL